jgi:hypothetical protein
MKQIVWACFVILFALPARADDTPPAYRPGVGDLMTSLVQPRHIKLWIARRQGNWTYAEYERKNLAEMLTKVGKNTPVYRKLDLPGLIESSTGDQLTRLEAAIKTKDTKAFDSAYADLTNGCNTCHQATGQTPSHIKVPTSLNGPFIDQDFVPQP